MVRVVSNWDGGVVVVVVKENMQRFPRAPEWVSQ